MSCCPEEKSAEFENYYFCCTHLSLTEDDRTASLSIINENIPTDKTVVIAGDFNDIPTSKFIGEFNKYFTIITDVGLPTFPILQLQNVRTLYLISALRQPGIELSRRLRSSACNSKCTY